MLEAHYGEIGVVITLNAKKRSGSAEDISGGSSYQIHWTKPDGTVDTWSASVSGTDGITYTTTSGDLDAVGMGSLQGEVTYAAGNNFYTTRVDFVVYSVAA